jgi:transposase-like protein
MMRKKSAHRRTKGMLNAESREQIRRAYYIEDKSMRQIAREQGHARKTVRKALETAEARPYERGEDHPSPVLGPYKARIQALLAEKVS